MENTKKFEKIGAHGGECAKERGRNIPVNIIRQFPERPGEWSKKHLIVFVCPDSDILKTENN